MKTIFTIIGNQEDPNGNPIPYFRQTQRSSLFNKSAKRYHAWKDYVRTMFWYQTEMRFEVDRQPFGKSLRGRLEVKIQFKGEHHADPDNIVKGLLDALFENDKHIDVTTSHTCGNSKGEVEVTIITNA